MKKVILYFPPINKLGNSAFREVCLNNGAEMVFTEMITAEKLLDSDIVQLKKLEIPKSQEEKIIVQIICEDIKNISKTVDKVMELKPYIKEINYNMGCPQSTLCKKECGGAIVGNTKKVESVAIELAKACKKYKITPSIKIRLGLKRDKITIYDNAKAIQNAGINKLYIHGRTLDDTYLKPATYNEITAVKELFPNLQIIANGDVKDIESYYKILKTNCDGVLIGRAALENPKVFQEIKENMRIGDKEIKGQRRIKMNLQFSNSLIPQFSKSGVNLEDRKEVVLEFLKYAKEYKLDLGKVKSNLAYMTRSVIGASKLREEINDVKSIDEIILLI